MPCDDVHGAECGDEIHFHQNDHQDNEDHSDNCSPLCECNCCQTAVELTQSIVYTSKRDFFELNPFMFYNEDLPSQALYAVWHPPKKS